MTSFLRRLFRPRPAEGPLLAPAPQSRPVPGPMPPPVPSAGPAPVVRKVLSVVHNPVVDREGRTLSQAMGWYDPEDLARQYAADVLAASHGYLDYRVVAREVRDGFPPLVDGFRYEVDTFLRCWRERKGFHQPEGADYSALLGEFDVLERVNAGEVDEVWLFGFPYAGYWESHMVGPGAFWCNSPPLERPNPVAGPRCRRRFVVMGFNYEREVGCMLENLGHRAESIVSHVYRGRAGEANLWERFSRYDQVAAGKAAVGNMHFAPNSTRDYDWGSPRRVPSECDDWLRFPRLTGTQRLVDCHDWGEGDMRLHHLWWFERLPHVTGETDGVANNWWTYVADPETV
jgi:hypothetical protein